MTDREILDRVRALPEDDLPAFLDDLTPGEIVVLERALDEAGAP